MRGQLGRLRRLARSALEHYGIRPARLVPLLHWNNTTFRVDLQPGNPAVLPGDSRHYHPGRLVLRISRPGFQDAGMIRAELAWLAALRRDLGLVLPLPLRDRRGDLVVRARAPGVPEPRDCVLFRWVRGRFPGRWVGARTMERAGALLARIHAHGRTFALPPATHRKTWDLERFLGADPGIDPAALWCRSTPAQRRIFLRAAARLRSLEQELGRDPELFGLIHGDFHHGNFLFHGSEIRPLDFDECGKGYFLHDLAVALTELRHRPDLPTLRRSLLRGYRSVRPLPTELERHLPVLMAARLLGMAVWTAGVPDHPENRRLLRRVLAESAVDIRALLAR
jgi:Ser/Thr protein kinase RdoA (MazF antagonist)